MKQTPNVCGSKPWLLEDISRPTLGQNRTHYLERRDPDLAGLITCQLKAFGPWINISGSQEIVATGLGWHLVLCWLEEWPNIVPVVVSIGKLILPSPNFRQLSKERERDFFCGKIKEGNKRLCLEIQGMLLNLTQTTKAVPLWVCKSHSIMGNASPAPNAHITAVTRLLDHNNQYPLNTWKDFSRRISTNKPRWQI